MQFQGKASKSFKWEQYRYIPRYHETITKVENKRSEMLLFVMNTSSHYAELQQVVDEVAQTASSLSVSFDEALFYKWRYYQNLSAAMNLIETIHRNK